LNSPALDQGSCPGLNFDQRDLPRPADVSGIANADDGCDIGTYELSGPDLALTKLVEPTTAVFLGAPITYTLIFSNIGGSVATGVLISDIVPLTLTNVSFASSGATITNTGLSPNYSWNIENLAPFQGGVITVTGQVNSNLTGDTIFTNTATITGSTIDLNITNNNAEAGVQVVVPGLSIHKTVVPDTDVPYRGEITYTIVLSNDNAFDISNTSLTDTLPISTTFVRWVQQSGAGESHDQITWNGTVTAGQSITFTFVANHIGDYNEVVTNLAEYSHPGGRGSTQASFTVEPGPPPVSINDTNVIEGNSGVSVATFDVMLSIVSTQTVTVSYATADGTAAVADNDYVAASGTLSFSPGRTQEVITVTINGDTRIEPDETFYINLLSVSTNGTIANGQGLGIITNDDFVSQPPQSPNDGGDDDDNDESDGSLPETPPQVPTSTAAPLPVQTLPETGMYEPNSGSLWFIISLLGIGGAIVWLIWRRYR
jgi:uncharacterized repeat protein (TIGR01451 family)